MCSGLPHAHYVLVEMLGALPTPAAHATKIGIGFCLPKVGFWGEAPPPKP